MKKNTERFIQNKTKINKRSASTVKNIFCIIIFGECVLFFLARSTYALLLIAQAKPLKKKYGFNHNIDFIKFIYVRT